VTRYLLDTTALIDFSKGWEPACTHIRAWIAGTDEVGICPIGIAEFYTGLRPADRRAWATFLGALQYWGISREAARQAGAWRYDFARQVIALSTTDTLLAAVAVEQGAMLVTSNVRHFPMPGVQLFPI
jgi:predicted nucleic acid-binding protein